ncbi:Gfo/Idh/MocA family protein [Crateriforma spongiae]|uniref:Gfo/Idh/MocA family protein n=1 Tax=Crateriforma spongiae TaxID=2724528 RepID=UPI00144760CC|nr:Gfo/Idh/MocA family oxidoreductase [Crateriforma spongiae]
MTKPIHPMTSTIDRRDMLSAMAGGIIAGGVWGQVAAEESNSAGQRLRLLCVGTANRAAANIREVRNQEIVGLCDVDQNYLDKAHADFPNAATFRDYREMIDAMADQADAIVIGASDHHHAPAAIRAIESGLHCYCEKPLTHTVAEARKITNAARRKGVATQMGTQIHAGSNYRRVVEIIRSGAIGDVTQVHVWVNKAWGGGELPSTADPVPPQLDWDLWIGPAAMRPYAKGQYHPAQWRRWWEFGQGTLGDMGCHYMDLPFWALGLKYPEHIQAEGEPPHPETCPLGLTVKYQFAASDQHGPLELIWYDGNHAPKEIDGHAVPGSGIMFVGTEGKMVATYGQYQLLPEDKFADFQPPEPSIPDSIGHHAEWIKACKDGTPTTCNFDYSGPLTETVLLGNVAYRTGGAIQWDADNLKVTNDSQANQYISKTYRPGWEV